MTTNYPLGLAAERGRAGDWRIVDNHRTVLATIHGNSGYAKGLAELWAAAPDLLAALCSLVTLCQEDESYQDPEREPDSYAALKRAEVLIAELEAQR
jgi:hypothetical protein